MKQSPCWFATQLPKRVSRDGYSKLFTADGLLTLDMATRTLTLSSNGVELLSLNTTNLHVIFAEGPGGLQIDGNTRYYLCLHDPFSRTYGFKEYLWSRRLRKAGAVIKRQSSFS